MFHLACDNIIPVGPTLSRLLGTGMYACMHGAHQAKPSIRGSRPCVRAWENVYKTVDSSVSSEAPILILIV